VRKSSPIVEFVGPTKLTQALPKLSVGVMDTPACDDAHSTSKSPPVLSNPTVVWLSCDVALIYPCATTTTGPVAPPTAVRFPGALGVGVPFTCVVALAVFEYGPRTLLVSCARTR